jgi:hypothetical protein
MEFGNNKKFSLILFVILINSRISLKTDLKNLLSKSEVSSTIIKQRPYCREVCEFNNPVQEQFEFISVVHKFINDEKIWKYICTFKDKDRPNERLVIYTKDDCKMINNEYE